MSPLAVKVTRKEATIHGRSNFLEAAIATQMGLQDAITKLKIKRATDESLSLAERSEIEARIGELEGQLALVQDRVIAFLANQAAVSPPSADELNAFKQLAVGLHEMVASAVAASAILNAATQLLTLWNTIR